MKHPKLYLIVLVIIGVLGVYFWPQPFGNLMDEWNGLAFTSTECGVDINEQGKSVPTIEQTVLCNTFDAETIQHVSDILSKQSYFRSLESLFPYRSFSPSDGNLIYLLGFSQHDNGKVIKSIIMLIDPAGRIVIGDRVYSFPAAESTINEIISYLTSREQEIPHLCG